MRKIEKLAVDLGRRFPLRKILAQVLSVLIICQALIPVTFAQSPGQDNSFYIKKIVSSLPNSSNNVISTPNTADSEKSNHPIDSSSSKSSTSDKQVNLSKIVSDKLNTNNINKLAKASPLLQALGDIAVVRHAPGLNSGRVEGTLRVLLGEGANLNSGLVVTRDLLLPGSPNININGSPIYNGTQSGNGSTTPSGYSVNLNSGVTLRHIVTNTNPITINNVNQPPQPSGTVDLSLNPGQSVSNFSTLRNLTLNSNYGSITIPPGTYGNFIANGNGAFIFGIAGQNTTYNLQALTLNSNTQLQILGNVTINLNTIVNLNSPATIGDINNPIGLSLNIANGGFNLNSNTKIYGSVNVPQGTVNVNTGSIIKGLLICDRLNLNGGLLQGFVGDTTSPNVTITQPQDNSTVAQSTITVTGTFTDDSVVTLVKVNNVTASINGNSFTASIPLTVGNNTITTIATDAFGNNGQSVIHVNYNNGTNQPPSVNAGADQTVTLPSTANLVGTATDDGLPAGSSVSVTWSKVSGAGTVSFSQPNQLTTTATFSTSGTYILRLTATDSLLSASDDVQITVNPQAPQNQAPSVNAGTDQTITLPSIASLTATANDDGLPNPPAALTYSWTKISGAGNVTFSQPNSLSTTATFSASGSYTLRFTASDSVLSSNDDVVITVNPASPQNTAPVVNAGADQTITLPSTASLTATANDDGLPNPPAALTYSWTKISGAGTVTFSQPTSLSTTATFGSSGSYTLRFTASDSELSSSDDIVITVNPATPQNQAPTVNAGADQSITLPQNATLNGLVSDDGLPQGSNLSITWTKVSGSGNVTFSSPSTAITQATFSTAGTYTLRLSASDTELTSSDDIIITVNAAPNQPPQVNAGVDQTITLPANASLIGTTTDDGLPQGSSVTVAWSQVSGSGVATFSTPNQASTLANFSLAGTYVLRLTASDSELSSSDDVVITVNPPAQNTPPIINAGVDQSVTVAYGPNLIKNYGGEANIVNSIPQDWAIASFFANWIKPLAGTAPFPASVEGSSFFTVNDHTCSIQQDVNVSIYDQAISSGNQKFTFTASIRAGQNNSSASAEVFYLANDGTTLASYSTTSVAPSDWTSFSDLHTAPIGTKTIRVKLTSSGGYIDALSLRALIDTQNLATATLTATVTDDGLPSPPSLVAVTWSKVSGPGEVSFANPNSANTTVSFSDLGTYVLRLTATDSVLSSFDELTINVKNIGNTANVVINAGDDQNFLVQYGPNLIKNPGNEANFVNNLPKDWLQASFFAGWIKPVAGTPPYPVAVEGASFFTVTGNGAAIQQDIDVSIYSQTIDNSTQKFTFNSSIRVGENTSSNAGVDVLYLSSNGTILASYTSNLVTPADWTTFSDVRLAPVGTRAIRVKLTSVGGYIDALSLHALINTQNLASTTLTGSVLEGTNPVDSNLYIQWSKVSGTGSVVFSTPNKVNTTVSFTDTGIYVLRLTASDLNFSISDELIVTITSPDAITNITVNAGADQSLTAPYGPNLIKNAGGEGNIVNSIPVDWTQGGFFARWVKPQAGSAPYPQAVEGNSFFFATPDFFGSIITQDIDVSLYTPSISSGNQKFAFNSSMRIGESNTSASVELFYLSSDGTTLASYGSGGVSPTDWTTFSDVRTAPVGTKTIRVRLASNGAYIDALSLRALFNTQSITSTSLTGSVLNGITPVDAFFNIQWSKLSGTGSVTFSSPTSVNTTASFTDTGSYVLRLTASSPNISVSDDLTINIANLNQAPQVNITANNSLEIEQSLSLQGTLIDDGNPNLTFSYSWTKVSGPGVVLFTQPNSISTFARFNTVGTYVLRLTASDSELSGNKDITINVLAGSITPIKLSPDSYLNIVGSNQSMEVILRDAIGNYITSATVTFTVTGTHTVTATASTDNFGKAIFNYIGTSAGNDQVKATYNALESNTSSVTWFSATQAVSTTSILGRFFAYPNATGAFAATPNQQVLITQYFPSVTFNSSFLLVPSNTSGVNESTTPFTNVATDVNGNFTGTIVVQGNGLQAAVGTLGTFQAVLTGNLVVNSSGNISFLVYHDDGFIFGVGNGAVKIEGPSINQPPDNLTVFEKYPIMGAYNQGSTPTGRLVTVFFPSAGTYPFEIDYNQCCPTQLSLTLTNSTNNRSVAPAFSLAVSPNTVADKYLGQTQSFTLTAKSPDGLPIGSLPVSLSIVGANAQTLSATTNNAGEAIFTYSATNVGDDLVQASFLNGSTPYVSNRVPVKWLFTNNIAPSVSAGNDQTITLQSTASLTATANDDGLPNPPATLTYSWTKVSGSGTVTFSNPNSLTTTATFSVAGTYTLRITVSDSMFSSSDDIVITVNAGQANQAPVVNAGADQSIAVTSIATLVGTATDDGLPTGSTLFALWEKVSGPGTVGFSAPNSLQTDAQFSVEGVYLLRLSVSDSLLTGTDDVQVTVVAPTEPAPVVTIHSPTDGTTITNLTDVVASIAYTGTSINWVLDYGLNANDDLDATRTYTTIATGNTTVSNSTIATFDPTVMLNGSYLLRLTATDNYGRSVNTAITLVLDKNLKVGNFTLSFTDSSVPVAGIPITVTRTYDSRDKRLGDFGIGWQLDIKNIRLEKTSNLGMHWLETLDQEGQTFRYRLVSSKAKFVTITFPDGKVFKFKAKPNPDSQIAAITTLNNTTTTSGMLFVAEPGTQGTLVSIEPQDLRVEGEIPQVPPGAGQVQIINNVGDHPGQPYNPSRFKLTTLEGTEFIIDEFAGLISLKDLNDNTLTINNNGIVHSSGKSISFTRDSQNRITQLTDPNNNITTYSYNAAGDLVSVTDAENSITSFSYNTNHYLLDITDPRGIKPIRNDYDSSGRLIKHTDSFGREIIYTHQIGQRLETITNRLGNPTILEYDGNGNVVKKTDALSNVTTYTYDALDNQLTETNAIGKTTTSTYDSVDNLLTSSDALGNTTTYTYNGRRQVLTITDPKGNTSTNTYDAKGNITSTKDAQNNTTTYTYTPAQGLLASTTDAQNNTTTYQYIGSRPTQITDAQGHISTFTYDQNGNQLTQTVTRTVAGSPQTITTTNTYDKLNRLTKVTYPDSSFTTTTYNAIGKVATSTDQMGRVTTYNYDNQSQLLSTTLPDGSTSSATYDAEGRRLTSTDQLGRITSFQYDVLGRLKKTTAADNSFTITNYDAIGRVSSTLDQLGHQTTFEYDPNCGCSGRRSKITDALNNITTFAYDQNSNQSSFTDARNNTTQYTYDQLNRQTLVTFPDSTLQSTAYDSLGRRTSSTDQDEKTTQRFFDSLGRLTKVKDALNQDTQYTYDELGQQLTQTDAKGRTTQYQYDNMGRRIKRILPEGQIETYSYDILGRLTSKTDFKNKVTTWSYDTLNRLISETPDPSFNQTPLTFTYNALGQRTSMNDYTGTYTYSYDNRNRPIQAVTPNGTLTYSYNAVGNILSVHSSNTDGVSIEFGYDLLNRLNQVNDLNLNLSSNLTQYIFDQVGNLNSVSLPNGITTTYQYSNLNRLSNMASSKAGNTISSYTYLLGNSGNRLRVSELSGRVVNYSYDSLYRLTNETITGNSNPTLNGSVDYMYDQVGNRTSRTSTLAAVQSQQNITIDNNDRLLSDTYDDNGNTTQADGKTFGYDYKNRIVSVSAPSVDISIKYNGDGDRVEKTVNGVTTKYLVDRNNHTGYAQVVEELQNNQVIRRYTRGLDLISQSQLINGEWSTHFFGKDGLGSTRFLTDISGSVTDSIDYDAFGNTINESGSTLFLYRFAGEQYDPDLGLYYNRARYLDVNRGRFWSQDTFEGFNTETTSLHKYLYTHADPVNKLDPTGKHFLVYTVAVILIASILAAYAVSPAVSQVEYLLAPPLENSQPVTDAINHLEKSGLAESANYLRKHVTFTGVDTFSTKRFSSPTAVAISDMRTNLTVLRKTFFDSSLAGRASLLYHEYRHYYYRNLGNADVPEGAVYLDQLEARCKIGLVYTDGDDRRNAEEASLTLAEILSAVAAVREYIPKYRLKFCPGEENSSTLRRLLNSTVPGYDKE